MKFLSGLLTLVLALVISAVAGYFSVTGLGHLFAAAFWPVVIMGGALEAGKLVAASWLKANWSNRSVGWMHKLYLMVAVGVLMVITALGIYGYLAKGHLEHEAPLATVELQIGEIERKVEQAKSERDRLEERLKGLDQSVNVMLSNAKTARDAQAANRARAAQQRDRADIQKQISATDEQINKLSSSIVPLRLQVSDVNAKLGPVKYVAQLFGWQDPNSAVQLVIVLIMFVFDPLAVMLVLSGTLTIGEWSRERQARKEASVKPVAAPPAPKVEMEDYIFPRSGEGKGTSLTTLPGNEQPLIPDQDGYPHSDLKRTLEDIIRDRDEQLRLHSESEERLAEARRTDEAKNQMLAEEKERADALALKSISLSSELEQAMAYIGELQAKLAQKEQPVEVIVQEDESKLTSEPPKADTTNQGKLDFASFSAPMFPKTNK